MATKETAAAARAARSKKKSPKKSQQQCRIERQLQEGRGPIDRGKDYPIALFKQLTGLGDYAIQRREEEGLFVHTIGNERRIVGDDWLDFLASQKAKKASSSRE